MKKIYPWLALTRWREYYGTVIFLSLLGLLFSGTMTWTRTLDVVMANLLSGAFAFMINDVEDWQDDAKDLKKKTRNPISAGLISPKMGMLASMLIGGVSLALYSVAGVGSLWMGLIGLILGYLYSVKKVRLKSVPVLDMVSHGLFLGVVYFAAMVFADGMVSELTAVIVISVLVFLVSVMGDMVNEVRDFEIDKKTGIKNTVQLLGFAPFGKYLPAVSTLVTIGLFIFVIMQLTGFGRLLTIIAAITLAGHYLWYFKTHKSSFYGYPFQQQGLTFLGFFMVIATRISA